MAQPERTNEELAVAIKAGDTDLMQQLFDQVERFINLYADRYWSALPEEQQIIFEKSDFRQCGWPAVCYAVKTFKPDSACSFCTWLGYYLHKEFVGQRGHRYHVDTDDDRKQYNRFIHADSLDREIQHDSDDRSVSVGDLVPDPSSFGPFESVEDAIFNTELRQELDRNVAQLPGQQQRVINQYYFQEQTLPAIAEHEACSTAWIATQRQHALRRLKQNALRQTGSFKSRLASFLDERTDFYHGTAEGAVIHREWLTEKCLRHPDLVINLPE